MNNADLAVLLDQIKQGDQQAFAKLYQLSASKLNGIAMLLMRDKEKANEVLHDAFIQIWQHAEKYDASLAEPMTWMSGIVRFRALDLLRKQNRRLEGKLQHVSELDADTLESKINWQHKQLDTDRLPEGMKHCLTQLPDSQRDAIYFAYLFGHSREEIAHIFETTVNTVKSWLHRGVRSLQQCMTN